MNLLLDILPQNKSKVSKFDKLTEDGVLQSVSKSSRIMAVSNDEMRSTSEKVAFHTEIVDTYVVSFQPFIIYQYFDIAVMTSILNNLILQEDSSTSTTNTQGATHLLDKEPTNASLGSSLTIADASIYEDGTNIDSNVQIPFKAAPLSNRERLMLRKQALKMRKRPVLAVGNSNLFSFHMLFPISEK